MATELIPDVSEMLVADLIIVWLHIHALYCPDILTLLAYVYLYKLTMAHSSVIR